MSMAIEHQEYFGAVATLAGALNLRYYNADERYFENFDPATYRWKTRYEPNEVIGKYYHGLLRLRAKRFMGPAFGEGDIVPLAMPDQPGGQAIHLRHPTRRARHLRELRRARQLQLRRPGRVVRMACRHQGNRRHARSRPRREPIRFATCATIWGARSSGWGSTSCRPTPAFLPDRAGCSVRDVRPCSLPLVMPVGQQLNLHAVGRHARLGCHVMTPGSAHSPNAELELSCCHK